MSALLEWQRAMRTQLLNARAPVAPAVEERLAIYRNTCFTTLVNALRLNFPAVAVLVGDEFFQAAARQFIAGNPPASAYLNDYGASFAAFLQQFPPAADITYLADVTRLEWAVSRALHAPDSSALDVAKLAALAPAQMDRVMFRARPGVTTLQLDSPADDVWRAVISQDDAAMAAVDLRSGAVHLLIERGEAGVCVQRMTQVEARFSAALLGGQTLADALMAQSAEECQLLLAAHLQRGRFSDFTIRGESA
jgi:hypothetical protein